MAFKWKVSNRFTELETGGVVVGLMGEGGGVEV